MWFNLEKGFRSTKEGVWHENGMQQRKSSDLYARSRLKRAEGLELANACCKWNITNQSWNVVLNEEFFNTGHGTGRSFSKFHWPSFLRGPEGSRTPLPQAANGLFFWFWVTITVHQAHIVSPANSQSPDS